MYTFQRSLTLPLLRLAQVPPNYRGLARGDSTGKESNVDP